MKKKTEKKTRDPMAFCAENYRLSGGVWSETRIFRKEGVAVLECRVLFPCPAAEGFSASAAARRVQVFYADLALLTADAVKERFLPAAERAFSEDTDPRKKFRYRRLRMLHEASVTEESEDILSVKRRLALSRGGKLLYEREEAEVFSKKSGALLSLGEAMRLFPLSEAEHAPQKKDKKFPFRAPFYIQNGEICFVKRKK